MGQSDNPLIDAWGEPLTNCDIMRSVLDLLQHNEWRWTYVSCPRGCCGEYEYVCASCKSSGKQRPEKHDPDCEMARAIKRAEAFIQAEEENLYGTV